MNLVEISQIPTVEEINDVPVDDLVSVYKVIMDMEKICTESNGIGISAVQVGVPWKMFLVKHPDGYRYYLNCEYEPIGDEKKPSIEGCLSIKTNTGESRHFLVERYGRVRIHGLRLLDICKLQLEEIDIELDLNELGVVFQHEIDHHNGILISDIGREIELR